MQRVNGSAESLKKILEHSELGRWHEYIFYTFAAWIENAEAAVFVRLRFLIL